MAAKGFGVKEGITWYMLSNILLAEGRGYSLGKKIVEENSNYENRKYTHKRKTLLYSKVAIIENKKKTSRQANANNICTPALFSFPNLIEFSSPLLTPPSQSLILNSVGCTEEETPEDLKSAFKMVSGSTSAGGFDAVLALVRRGSPSFFTEGVSLNRSNIGWSEVMTFPFI